MQMLHDHACMPQLSEQACENRELHPQNPLAFTLLRDQSHSGFDPRTNLLDQVGLDVTQLGAGRQDLTLILQIDSKTVNWVQPRLASCCY